MGKLTVKTVQDLSLSNARLEAATKMKQVREGADPLLQSKRAEQESIRTVNDLFDDWYPTLVKRLKHPNIPKRVYYGSHHSRRQAILKAFYDLSSAQIKCRGDNNDYRFFNLGEIILQIKFDWQQVFLHANYSWIEQDNIEQVGWLNHNLMAKDSELELPWIVTDTQTLHDALLTYLDLSFLQHPEDTAKKIETLRKAWVRRNGNDNAELFNKYLIDFKIDSLKSRCSIKQRSSKYKQQQINSLA